MQLVNLTSPVPEAVEYDDSLYDNIVSRLQVVQKRARARLLSEQSISILIDYIKSNPYGEVRMYGGTVYKSSSTASATYLRATWYTLHNKKYVYWSCYRVQAPVADKHESLGEFTFCKFSKLYAWATIFPHRHSKYVNLRYIRSIRRAYGIDFLSFPQHVFDNIDLCDDRIRDYLTGVFLVIKSAEPYSRPYSVLCSKLGVIKLPRLISSVSKAFEFLGIILPDSQATWEDIELQWIAVSIASL